MTTQLPVDDAPQGRSKCWCCGVIDDPAKLVHLGNHPEATICTRCAHSISKWASEIEDRSRTGVAVRARDQFRRPRKSAVRHGWHHTGLSLAHRVGWQAHALSSASRSAATPGTPDVVDGRCSAPATRSERHVDVAR
jgi:hypothetical protein